MTIEFTRRADEDLEWLKRSGNKQAVEKVKELLRSINETPFNGIGQP